MTETPIEENYCKIEVDTVHPNEILNGKLDVLSSKPVQVNHIYIEYHGIASCKWKLSKVHFRFPFIYNKGTVMEGLQHFYYARHNIYVSDEPLTISGKKTFAFSTKLPHGPPTLECNYGKVYYYAVVIIKHPDSQKYEHKHEFKVMPRLDLTEEKNLVFEARQTVIRKYHFGMVDLGTVQLSVWLPLCGYARGQSIPVLCNIKNNSEVRFGGIIFVLTMMENYRSCTPFRKLKKFRKDICRTARIIEVIGGTYDYFALLEIDDDVPPTTQHHRSNCCHVTYEVWVTLQASLERYAGYGYPHMCTPGIPIIVGTEPVSRYKAKEVTANVMKRLLSKREVIMNTSASKGVEEFIQIVEDTISHTKLLNIDKQVTSVSDEDQDYDEQQDKEIVPRSVSEILPTSQLKRNKLDNNNNNNNDNKIS